MNRRRYAGTLELFLHGITILDQYCVLRPHTAATWPHRQQACPRAAGTDRLAIAIAELDASRDLPIQAGKLRQQDRALERIHAAADADARVQIARALPVDPNLTTGLCERGIVGEDGSAITVAAERLAGKEAGATHGRQRATAPAVVAGAKALGGILDDCDRPTAGPRRPLSLPIGRPSIKTHRDEGLGSLADRRLQQA